MFEQVSFLAASEGGSNMVTKIATQFGVNLPMFISQLVAFCIVAWLLNKFAYKPVIDVLEERKQRIATSMNDAEKIKAELAAAEEKSKELLAAANEQSAAMIAEAREAAGRVRETESQKAIKDAEGIIAKAREATEADHARMMAELKAEVGRLVVDTTAKVLGKTLSADDQKRLIAEAGKDIKKS